jgi:hypothetical protein
MLLKMVRITSPRATAGEPGRFEVEIASPGEKTLRVIAASGSEAAQSAGAVVEYSARHACDLTTALRSVSQAG